MDAMQWVSLLRANVAGAQALTVRAAAEVLFDAGGRQLLADGTRAAVRGAVERAAGAVIGSMASPAVLGEGLSQGVKQLTSQAASALSESAARRAFGPPRFVGRAALRAAGREVLTGVGRAAAVGLVVEGVAAGIEAALAHRRGEMTRDEAVAHTAREAAFGAVATGVGVAVAAGAVAVTGGLSAPVVFALGTGGSIGTRVLLRRATRKFSER